ncbi:hypothetical protein BDR26DRAFT_849063 [Obelidium mucronatum]|nr:hypothetical protein BDR26DRAFT_849063 [Obelidium mucronatum]
MEKVEISATDLVGIYGGKILNKKERCELIAKMFRDNEAIQPDSMLTEGIVGRFVAGTRNEDFERLAGESVNEVAFVFGGDTIRTFCGMSASKALISLGFTKETLVSMSKSNFKHKLILFPEPSLCRQAKWHHVMEMVLDCYGQDVHRKLLPHLTDLKLTDYKDIDPHQRLIEIASLPHHEKMKHPEFYSPSKIRKISNVSLYDARGFFYHSMRCNPLFEGLGYTRSRNGDDDRAEYLVRNHKISELVDAVVVDVEFYENELV